MTRRSLPETEPDAELSDCGKYRWWLSRRWGDGTTCVFIMLNPSTADAQEDDATIRRCVGFADRWGHKRLLVVNLFAYRATHPSDLMAAFYPVGGYNDDHIRRAVEQADKVVVAWGNAGAYEDRDTDVMELLDDTEVQCLGVTRYGCPKHPVRLAYDTPLVPYEGRPELD